MSSIIVQLAVDLAARVVIWPLTLKPRGELREFTKCRTYPSVVWICKVFSCPNSCIPSRYYLPLWDTDKVTATATAKRTKGQKDKNTKTNKRVYYCDIWALGNDLFILSVKCFDFMNWWVGQNQSFFLSPCLKLLVAPSWLWCCCPLEKVWSGRHSLESGVPFIAGKGDDVINWKGDGYPDMCFWYKNAHCWSSCLTDWQFLMSLFWCLIYCCQRLEKLDGKHNMTYVSDIDDACSSVYGIIERERGRRNRIYSFFMMLSTAAIDV